MNQITKIAIGAFIASAIVAITTYASFAQQPQSPNEQALGQKLLQEISAGVQCNASVITMREALEKEQVEVKRLKDKYEPTKSETKK